MKEETEKKIVELITEHGLKVSGMGMLAENTKKQIEILDKIQKFIYFMEKRQTDMEKVQKEMVELIKEKLK